MIDTGGLVFSLRCMPGARRYLRMVLPYVFPRVGVHMRDAEERESSSAFALCLIALRVAEEVFGD